MGKPQEAQLRMTAANGVKETHSLEDSSFLNQVNRPRINNQRRHYHWFRTALYAVFVLLGESAATLLGRLYYEKGGKSKWLGTLVQLVGFPILLPYYCTSVTKNPTRHSTHSEQPSRSASLLAFIYVSLGLLVVLDCYMYSIGLWYLPVSTFSLVISSQLAFNAFFSFFLNSLKFTPCIMNSLVLLTISSTLLVFQTESANSTQVSKKNYVIGFICTVAAAAANGLLLSLTQLAFMKILKREAFKMIMDLIMYESLVATSATLAGLFASGEWNGLKKEMEEFEAGKASYLLNLTFTAILWQLYNIGSVGLIFEVSSLFSNSISVLGLPIVPILAVIFFHDKMHGIKAISMMLAVWGFISYVYQNYLDDSNPNIENRNTGHLTNASTSEETSR